MEPHDSSSPDLAAFRDYLLVLVRGQIPASMRARLDASDIVQQTLLEAHRKRDQYYGPNEPQQFAGWLRQILSYNLLDAFRREQSERRDVRREIDIQNSLEQSAMGLENLLVADDSSPSQQVDRRLMAFRLAGAIESLPEEQRQSIILRYCHQSSLEEIAERLEKSKPAVAGLLKRGLASLRERFLKASP